MAIARERDRAGWATIRLDVSLPAPAEEKGEWISPTCFVRGDVTDELFMSQLAEAIVAPRDSFAMVAAAGVISTGTVESMSLATWQRVLNVNLSGTFLALRSGIAAARAAETGRLVAIASDAAKTGEAWLAHYCASKFGVVGLVQSLALELVHEGITVNAICPSILETPMMAQLAAQFAEATGEGDSDTWQEAFVAEIPAGRACLPRDVEHALRYLLAPEADFVTGQAMNLAGGHETH